MRRAAGAALGLGLLAACAAPQPRPGVADLTGSAWMLSELRGEAAGEAVSLNFDVEAAHGVSHCGRYRGGWTQDGARVRIGPVVATRRDCPAREREDAYLSALTDAATVSVAPDNLTMFDSEGEPALRFLAAN